MLDLKLRSSQNGNIAHLSTSSDAHRRAFTLVELLVVISVITLLIALLLPALSKAMGASKTASCQVNFRSLGQAFAQYASDNKGLLTRPEIADPSTNPTASGTSPSFAMFGWDYALTTYLSTRTAYASAYPEYRTVKPGLSLLFATGVFARDNIRQLQFYCPAYQRIRSYNNRTPGATSAQGPYGGGDPTWQAFMIGTCKMNAWLGIYGVTTSNDRRNQLAAPRNSFENLYPQTFLMGEAYDTSYYGVDTSIYYNPLHNDQSPLLFADGSVKFGNDTVVPGGTIANMTTVWTNRPRADQNFWGYYQLKFYANPGTEPWIQPANY
jgi:prepilin-type N-terminal cleavage/methylation domain-containing protein/prepilin-type processing-associated H-X9-DG protein